MLTLAEIYEISLVAIPADPNSLASVSKQSDKQTQKEKEIKQQIDLWLEELKK